MKKSSTDSIRVQSAKNSQIVIDKRKHKQSFNESPNKFNSESLGNWRPITAHTAMSSGFFNEESLSKLNMKKVYFNGPGAGKYGRGSGIGFVNHDPTLTQQPAYSMGKASRVTDLNSSSFYFSSSLNKNRPGSSDSFKDGPGPGKYARPSTIGIDNTDPTLRKNPAFSIGRTERSINFSSNPFFARPKSPKSSLKRPGPTDYHYEAKLHSYKTQAPSFSIGKASRFPDFSEYVLC